MAFVTRNEATALAAFSTGGRNYLPGDCWRGDEDKFAELLAAGLIVPGAPPPAEPEIPAQRQQARRRPGRSAAD